LEGKIERLLDDEPDETWSDGFASDLDARGLSAVARRADVMLTSPPFYDSTRFHANNWMRAWFCGWDPADFAGERERFLEYQQKRDFGVYADVVREFHRVLRPGALAVWHLGRSRRFDMAGTLEGLAQPWFSSDGLFEEDVSACQSHGVSDQGGTHTHQFLLMRAR
jgi:hypothetical protein